MSVKGGPDIVTDGLVFNLDAAGAVSDKAYPINGLIVEYLIVAGGGGGGGRSGGGGGAGGLLNSFITTTIASGDYTVLVGAGGSGGAGTGPPGSDGQNSSFGSLSSIGGGGGGSDGATTGRTGGSGGGGKYGSGGGSGTSGQGFAGGSGTSGSWKAGGGGGAGGVGANGIGNPLKCGDGGPGLASNISSTLNYYAGGGGGGSHNSYTSACCDDFSARGLGGIGGGGDGGTPGGYNSGTNGTANTGGGGGGGSTIGGSGGAGGNGGSGIVIIRYKGSQKASGGDSIFNYKGFTVHVFTSSGTFTVGDRVGGLSTSKIVGTLENMDSTNYNSGNKGYFTFDGTDESIGIYDFNVSDLGGNFTMCSLFKPVSAFSYIFSSKDASPSTQTYNIAWFRANNNIGGLNADTMWLQLGRASWHWQIYGSNGLTLALNNWHYVAVTAANLNTSSHTIKFYVNNQSVTGTKWTVISAAPINYGGSIQESTFLSRAYTATSPSYNSAYTEANIAMFQIYNKALSANEVEQNYNATKGRFGL
jgi:hypothetical protein